MNLPDPTEVMKAADAIVLSVLRDFGRDDDEPAEYLAGAVNVQPFRARLESAVRTYGAACAAAAEPSEWQLLALAFDDVRSGANLLPAQRSAAINLGRRRWEAFRAAGGIGAGGSQG